jgi:two-component system CheB/CheR fusion protein
VLPTVLTGDPPCGDFLVAAIGASSGGLNACKKLAGALPSGMAFIIVHHSDPTVENTIAAIAPHTSLRVRQATDGMLIESGYVYITPHGTYLGARDGALRLSREGACHGSQMPFDFLLHSLAHEFGGARSAWSFPERELTEPLALKR